MRKILFIISVAIAVGSCIGEEDISIGEVKQFQVKNIAGTNIKCAAEIEIENKYFLPVTISEGNLEAYSGKDQIGKVVLLKPVRIKSKTKEVYLLDLEIEITKPLSGLKSVIGSLFGKKSDYELKGTLMARQLLISRKIEINKTLTDK